jgi:maltose alpha-D-glucosyltransferase / alpha-amylase
MRPKEIYLEDDPLWYKDAVIYQLHVKTFFDGNNDGMGDFSGLAQKLDYLEDLGVTAIWLLPFYPSPLRDDGYDIADYYDVHPDYGTLKDFKEFLSEAHRRGLRVITELVINHTSDQHRWFQRSRKAPAGSIERDYYVWSDTPEKYKDARIIFKDFEASNWTWDAVAKAYYWHRFYSHQPDLNFDSPHVQKAVLKALDYWLNIGVDGLRLDAIPYLFEREGTNCENLPETHAFLQQLRSHLNEKFKSKMLLAEANQWPEDAAAYFGNGNECHTAFHFPLMPRIFMAVRMEDRFPIVDILTQTPSIPPSCQWVIFLRNHDELTLEMVTDEERDYMYRMYASDHTARINLGIRRRLAPLMENDRRKINLMNVLLLSLPGAPVVYYGDELGMGDNYYLGDRNGVRTPMQWSADRNAGFSRANPQKLYLPVIIDPDYHYEASNVETQEHNQASLLWWMKRFIAMRKRFKAFGRGSLTFLYPDNPKVLAFVRQYEDENILVVVNLARHSQAAEVDLSPFAGYTPEEVFGRNKFPQIRESSYVLTLGSYGYYWFALRKQRDAAMPESGWVIPELAVAGNWENVLEDRVREKLETSILPAYLKERRWFGGKAREIQQLQILEDVPVEKNTMAVHLLFLEVQYTEGLPEVYLLPVAFATAEKAKEILDSFQAGVIARLKMEETEGILYDAVYNGEFRQQLLRMMAKKHKLRGSQGEFIAHPTKAFKKFAPEDELALDSQVLKVEQSNTALIYGNKLFLKLFRRLEEGLNPDLEIGSFITEKTAYTNIPSVAGALEYRKPGAEPMVLGILQALVPNEGDAWKYSLDSIGRYFERVLSKKHEIQEMPQAVSSLLELAFQEIPALAHELIGGIYLERATLLGKRTAELHLALASNAEDPDFAPEPFSVLYQRSIYQSMQSAARRSLQLLKKNLASLSGEEIKKAAEEILQREKDIMDHYGAILKRKLSAMKIRIHGDYHLGQVLYTGNDFIIIDFEGEPAKALSERRLKRSPFRDVAGMIRSFHYAVYTGLLRKAAIRQEDIPMLKPWADLWYKYVAGAFLRSYLETSGDAPFMSKDRQESDILLRTFLLEKAIYELGYELNNRPDWLVIPINGIKQLLEA